MDKTFGELVQKARTAAGLSQRELARRIGKSASYINYVESGKNPSSRNEVFQPSPEAVDAIARVLRLPIDEARLAAGYAPKHASARPRTVPEFLEALEALGVGNFHAFEGVQTLPPEALADLYDDLTHAVELFLMRSRRPVRYLELEIEPDDDETDNDNEQGKHRNSPRIFPKRGAR